MVKLAELSIYYCNSKCPHFYHKFSDCENIWCNKLDAKVYDAGNADVLFDFRSRPIPKECPLEDI
jgi:hypothetical protein